MSFRVICRNQQKNYTAGRPNVIANFDTATVYVSVTLSVT